MTKPKLHHLHAELARGTKQRAAVSFDIGDAARVRLDGTKDADKVAIARRLTVLWNMHEGIPTEVLEGGAVREFYDAVEELVQVVRKGSRTEWLAAAASVEAKWTAITIEPTAKGKRADCSCSEDA